MQTICDIINTSLFIKDLEVFICKNKKKISESVFELKYIFDYTFVFSLVCPVVSSIGLFSFSFKKGIVCYPPSIFFNGHF